MERELINQQYLQELLVVADDQEEGSLISEMFGRLLDSRELFLKQSGTLIHADHQKLQFELHKLKNQFANLGCEAVSHLLEDMYQLAKREQTDEIESLLPEFQQLSEVTIQQLQNQIKH